MSGLRFIMFLFLCLNLHLAASAQSVKRESIGTLGASSTVGNTYFQECFGQPFQTLRTESSYSPGFIQPQTTAFAIVSRPFIIKAYPVPVREVLHLEWNLSNGATSINVYNLQGIRVQQILEHTGNSSSIQCGELTPGVYIIEVQTEQRIQRMNIIKQ